MVGKGTTVVTQPLPRVFGIFFNPVKNKTFADQNVISALNLATDKGTLINDIFKGYASPLNGPLPLFIDKASGDYDDRKQLAAKMLDAAGWKINPATGIREKLVGKSKQSLSFSLATANTPELEASAELIANQYNDIGVHVDVKVFEIGTLNENIIKGRDFEALLFGQVIKHDTDIYAFWHSSQKVNPGLNITSYTNKRVDGLLESAIKESDPSKRTVIYQAISQQLAKDAPVIFLYAPNFIYLTNASIHHAVIPPITGSPSRFSLVYQWYRYADRTWKGLIN